MQKELIVLSVVALLLVPYLIPSSPSSDSFEEWKLRHRVTFSPSEEMYRRLMYQQNLVIIERHNSNLTRTYDMGTNQFSIYSD